MSFTESLDKIVALNTSGLLSVHPTWERVRLGAVCTVLNGFPFASENFTKDEGMPLLRIRDASGTSTEAHYRGSFDPNYVVEPGDLVVGMDGDFNSALWRGPPALLNQRVCRLRPAERFYRRRFLNYALQGYLKAINAQTSAITVKHLSSKTLADIPLPLPPVSEQDRIAAYLDEQMASLGAATAALERAQANLKRYRASVLKASVEGRLVPTEAALARAEGRDYEPASVLLKRILVERRRRWEEAELARLTAKGTPPTDDRWKSKYEEPSAPDATGLPDLPEGWCWANVDSVAEVGTGGTPRRGDDRFWSGGQIPWITSSAIHQSVVRHADECVTEAALNETNLTMFPPGTLLLAMYGEGKTRGGVTELGIAATTNQALAALVFSAASTVTRPWVRLVLECGYLSLRERSAGGVQPNLNLGIVRSVAIPVPPLREQQRVLEAADDLRSCARASLDLVTTSAQREQALRRVILCQAFRGNIVDQDPTDEPASALLARIQAERSQPGAAESPRRGRRKTRTS